MFNEAIRCAAPEGRILVIGFASGDIPQVPANLLLIKNIAVIGVNMGLYSGWTPIDERKRYAPRMKTIMESPFAMLAAGEIKPEMSAVYPIDRVVDALNSVTARESTGRVLLQIRPQE